jgi:hypothetical protein
MPHSSGLLLRVAVAVSLSVLAGCGRTPAVVPEETTSLVEDEPVKTKVVRAQAEDSETARFAFPDDVGGVLLAKVLPPRDPETTLRAHSLRKRGPVDTSMRPPSLPLPPSMADVPRSPTSDKHVALRPRVVSEETLFAPTESLRLPPTPPLPDNGRIRVPSPDVNQPIPLPILARPFTDRASLEDPTLEASAAAAVAAPIPPRVHKAPFLKQTVPDPFDHRRTGTPLPNEPKE